MSDELKQYEQAAFHFGTLVHGIRDRDVLGNATPDTEWTVRDLLNHLVNEALWAPALIAGETVDQVGDRFDGDLLGDDPAASWNAAGEAARAAIAEAPQHTVVHLSYGDTPLSDYVREMTDDLVIHGWDLAKGIGADDSIDPSLVTAVWQRNRSRSAELRSSGLFGPEVDVPADADAQTRLLALFGRRR